MTVIRQLIVCGIASAMVCAVSARASAQDAINHSGHWAGTLDVPAGPLRVEVDLVRSDGGEYFGVVSIPDQDVNRAPLSSVSVVGQAVTFQIVESIPGDNVFQLMHQSDGRMTGSFTHRPYTMNLSLTRTGEPQLTPPARSTAIEKTLEGRWRGVLDIDGQRLRVELVLSTGATGAAEGVLVSLDQGNARIPVTSVTQAGSDVRLDVRSVGATFAGVHSTNADELAGTWVEGRASVPLTFKKADAAMLP